MLFVIARQNAEAPYGYSYFIGSMETVATENGAAVVPSTSWDIEAGFVFPSPRAALPFLQLFRQICPAHREWFVVRHPAERAA